MPLDARVKNERLLGAAQTRMNRVKLSAGVSGWDSPGRAEAVALYNCTFTDQGHN